MMGIFDRIARGTRNTVQRLPGGSEAFPVEANGTVNWLGNPLRGDNVLGAAFRGASGLDTAESIGSGIGSLFGRGRDQTLSAGQFSGAADQISRDAASRQRPLGSVVARGFISRQSLGPTARQPGPAPQQAPVPDFAGMDNWGTRQPAPTGVDPNFRMPGTGGNQARPSRTPGSAAQAAASAWQRRGLNQGTDDSLAWAGSPGAMSENMIETRFGIRPMLRAE